MTAKSECCRWCGKPIQVRKYLYGSNWIHKDTWRRECEPWHVAEPGGLVDCPDCGRGGYDPDDIEEHRRVCAHIDGDAG